MILTGHPYLKFSQFLYYYFENSTDFFLKSFISLLSSRAAFLARVPAALLPFTSCASEFFTKTSICALICSIVVFIFFAF